MCVSMYSDLENVKKDISLIEWTEVLWYGTVLVKYEIMAKKDCYETAHVLLAFSFIVVTPK